VVSITNILVFPDNAKYTLTFKSLGSVRYVLQKLIVLFIKDAFNWSKVTTNIYYVQKHYISNTLLYHGFHNNIKQHNYFQHW